MPKRQLSVQNKGTEHEQQQTSSVLTRLSSKRVNTDESVVSIKKPKIEEKHSEKENIPTRQTRQSSKRKESVRLPSPTPPPAPVNIIEPIVDKNSSTTHVSDNESEYDHNDDDDEEDEQPIPSTATDDNGKDYPGNKQYIIYENAGPNKEPFVISKTARYWNHKYRKVLRHVNPDTYGMYIHNDFSCYGELEVVENCLLDLTKAVFIVQHGILARLNYVRKPADTVNYVLAFRRLEALTILLDYTDGISGIDDGDRFYEIMRVIGACYVTILRGLLPQVMFTKMTTIDRNLVKKLSKIAKQLPNFKQVLERALIVGHMFLTIGDVCSTYTTLLQIVYCNWLFIMEQTTIDLNEKPKDMDNKVWLALKHAASIDKNDIEHGDIESFDFMKELRSYKGQYGCGGDAHDLSKWSRAERAAHSFGRMDSFANLWF